MAGARAATGEVTAGGGASDGRPAWDWNRLLTPPVVLRMLPIVAFLVAAYWVPLTRWEAVWRSHSAWGHGYLIPVIAVVLAHFRLKELPPRRLAPCLWGLGLIVAGLVIRIWSQTLKFGFPGDLTFLLAVGGTVMLLLGWEAARRLWIPVAYLGLMIPWDTKYYDSVALPLQRLGAVVGERLLVLAGYQPIPMPLGEMPASQADLILATGARVVCRADNVLHLSSGPLAVAEACSGLHLLFAFVALGVMMAYIHRRPLWERLVIMVSSVPIAVLCNVIRVTLMALASDALFFETGAASRGAPTWSAHVPESVLGLFKGTDLVARLVSLRQDVLNPESVLHQSFGFAMLGLAFLLMWAELRVIDMFFIEDDQNGAAGAPGDRPAPTAS